MHNIAELSISGHVCEWLLLDKMHPIHLANCENKVEIKEHVSTDMHNQVYLKIAHFAFSQQFSKILKYRWFTHTFPLLFIVDSYYRYIIESSTTEYNRTAQRMWEWAVDQISPPHIE